MVNRSNANLNLGANGTTYFTIAGTGRANFVAPSSGTNVTIDQAALGAGGVAGVLVKGNSGSLAQIIIAGNGATPATNSFDMIQDSSNNVLLVNRASGSLALYTNNTSRFQITSAGVLSGYGATAAGLVDLTPDTGTFTATYTGMTASVTCTATWARVGKVVTLTFCTATGTSNSTAFTMTGLPSAIQPSALAQHVSVAGDAMTNNSITVTGIAGAGFAAGSGTVTFFLAGSSTGWTASNTKGFNANASVSYQLN